MGWDFVMAIPLIGADLLCTCGLFDLLSQHGRIVNPAKCQFGQQQLHLGLYRTVRHFRSLLEGQHFTAFVDHKPPAKPWSACQHWQLSLNISELITDIQHVASKTKIVSLGPSLGLFIWGWTTCGYSVVLSHSSLL